ncbi:MAG: PAS domain S-box protein [Methanoculleus sp.]
MTGKKKSRDDTHEFPPGTDICLSILREAPDGLVLVDGERRCRYVNPAFTRITGYTEEDIPTLAQWFKHAHPNPVYRQKVQGMSEALFSGDRDVLISSVVCRDGRVRDIEFRRVPVDGECVMIVVRDVTERTLTEDNLRQATSELTAVIEAFPDLFIRLNADGTVLEVRAGKLAETQLISRAHLGRRIQDLLPTRVGRDLSTALQEAVRTNTPAAPLEFSRTIAGEARYFEARVMPLRELHLMVIIREITERKVAEEELHRHREHLEELVAERTAELKRANERLEELLYYIEVTERKAAESWLDLSVERGSFGTSELEDARITTDVTGTVVIVDMAAERLTGYRGDELAGKPVWSLFRGDALQEFFSGEVLGRGRPARYEGTVELVKSDGSNEAVHVSGDPIADGAGTVIGMVCTFRRA